MGIEEDSVNCETSSEEGPKSKSFVFSLTLLSPRNYLEKSKTCIIAGQIFMGMEEDSVNSTKTSGQQQQFNQCQLDRLDALEPNNRIKAEAGVIESWDPNDRQFQCVGVAVVRRTIEPNGLLLPQYDSAPQLIYIQSGYGILGAHFYLAGNPEDEFQLQGRSPRGQRRQQQQGQGRRERGQQQQGQGNNLFSGFRTEDLADAFNVDEETIRNLQGFQEDRKNIVRVKGRLQVARPPRSREEREGLERQEREQEREDEREQQRESRRGGREEREREERQEEREEEREQERERRESRRGGRGRGRGRDNGIEETLCTLRLRENIHDPSRADVYNPQAGRISTLNSHNLPVLRWLQLSAVFGRLQRDAIYVPHWNRNAHSVIYVVKGRAQVQVVDDFGQAVFDDELQQGQILTVPQNFAVVKRASSSEGFEWVAFKTNDNAQISPLAGQNSVLRAIPADVLANAFQLSQEGVSELKSNLDQQEITIVRPSRSSSQRKAIA
ncbi:hypothetical protein ACJW30_10G012000 [Castanea mollissima]